MQFSNTNLNIQLLKVELFDEIDSKVQLNVRLKIYDNTHVAARKQNLFFDIRRHIEKKIAEKLKTNK